MLSPRYTRLLSTSRIAIHVNLSQPVFVRIEPTVAHAGNSFVFTHTDFVGLRKPGGDGAMLEGFGLAKFVLYPQISWEPQSQAIGATP